MSLLALIGLTAMACGTVSRTDELAGGQTEDFTGDIVECDAQSEERPGDTPHLGFSLSEVLAAAEGVFDVRLRWQDGCRKPTGENGFICKNADQPFEVLDGVETTARIEVTATNAPAIVFHPTAAQPACAQKMLVPVTGHLSSLDGLLDETFETHLETACGRSASVDVYKRPSSLTGDLGNSSFGLSDAMEIEFGVSFIEDRVAFKVAIVEDDSGALVLGMELPPFGENARSVPRTSVEQQQGSPMPSGHCPLGF